MEIGTAHPQKDTSRPIMLPTFTESQYLLDRYQVSTQQGHSCIYVHHSTVHKSQALEQPSCPKTEARTKELLFVDTMEFFQP